MRATSAPKTFSEGEFLALCSLLEEDDPRTFQPLARDFKHLLIKEPAWKSFIGRNPSLAAGKTIQALLQDLHCEDMESSFRRLMAQGESGVDLEEGLFLLGSFRDPGLRRQDFEQELDAMAGELAFVLEDRRDGEQVIELFRQYFFEKKGFRGNSANYYDPDNSYLPQVLERRLGIPVSLSSVCLLVARRIAWEGGRMPLSGVGLPGHFILQFKFGPKTTFMDPFNRGKLLGRRDCMELLRRQEVPFRESYLSPVNDHMILTRTMTNLVHIYSDSGDQAKADRLLSFLQILNEEAIRL